MTREGLCVGAALLFLAGCYTYRPLPSPEPVVGTRISVQLTDDGSRRLAPEIGPDVLHVEGDVLSADSSAVELSVRQVEDYRGMRSGWNGEHVALPRQIVAGMQQRRLSVGATGLMGGLVTVGMVALYGALGGGGLFEGNGGTGGTGGSH